MVGWLAEGGEKVSYGYRVNRHAPRSGAAAQVSYAFNRAEEIAPYAKYAGDNVTLAEYSDGNAGPVLSALSPEEYTNLLELKSRDGSTQLRRLKNLGTVRGGRSVVSFEFVTTVSKDQSLAWALGDEGLREAVEARIALLNEARMRVLAGNLITRVGGRGEQRLVRGRGMSVAMFVHHDSRAGDPHLHIHDSVINDTVGEDGAHHAIVTRHGLNNLCPLLDAIEKWGMASNRAYRQAFADRGLHLNADGSIEGMDAMVRAASKRKAQAEANYARLVGEWRERNGAGPDAEPDARTRQKFRQLAWAQGRPAKDHDAGDERGRWAMEYGSLPRGKAFTVEKDRDVDWNRIAHDAVERCTSMAPAFSRWQLEAQIVNLAGEAGADVLASLERIDALTTATLRGQIDLAMGLGAEDLGGQKRYTTAAVLEREQRIRDLVDRLDAKRYGFDVDDMPDLSGLSDDQRLAVAGLRGSVSGIEIVEGAAGAGKTTMLARAAEGRDVVALAPSRKAANELGESLGCEADSVQKFLWDRGWRRAENGVLHRDESLCRWEGSVDPARGGTIIVDETGMLRQDDAVALLGEADRLDCRVWLVGDRSQLPAVGAGGVLQLAIDVTGRHMELDSIHRFRGKWGAVYGEFSKQLRDRRDPEGAFDRLTGIPPSPVFPSVDEITKRGGGNIAKTIELLERAHVDRRKAIDAWYAEAIRRNPVCEESMVRAFDDADRLAEWIAGRWTEKTAVTVPDNERARLVGRLVHERLKREGRAKGPATCGRMGAEIMAGDLIAVRRNERGAGLVNRQVWHVDRVNADGSVQATLTESRHPRGTRISAAYLAANAEHGYAATPWGVQGVTMDRSITWMDENSTANMMYVGQTRGRYSNMVVAVADGLEDMKRMYADAYRNEAATGLVDEAAAQVREQIRREQGVSEPQPEPRTLTDREREWLDVLETMAREELDGLAKELETAQTAERAADRAAEARTALDAARSVYERDVKPLDDAVESARSLLADATRSETEHALHVISVQGERVNAMCEKSGARVVGREADLEKQRDTYLRDLDRLRSPGLHLYAKLETRGRVWRRDFEATALDIERRLSNVEGRLERIGEAKRELKEFRERWGCDPMTLDREEGYWRDGKTVARKAAEEAAGYSRHVGTMRERLEAAQRERKDSEAANRAARDLDKAEKAFECAQLEERRHPLSDESGTDIRARMAAFVPRDGQSEVERYEQLDRACAGIMADRYRSWLPKPGTEGSRNALWWREQAEERRAHPDDPKWNRTVPQPETCVWADGEGRLVYAHGSGMSLGEAIDRATQVRPIDDGRLASMGATQIGEETVKAGEQSEFQNEWTAVSYDEAAGNSLIAPDDPASRSACRFLAGTPIVMGYDPRTGRAIRIDAVRDDVYGEGMRITAAYAAIDGDGRVTVHEVPDLAEACDNVIRFNHADPAEVIAGDIQAFTGIPADRIVGSEEQITAARRAMGNTLDGYPGARIPSVAPGQSYVQGPSM